MNSLGIDIGGTNTKIVLLDGDFAVQRSGEFCTEAAAGCEAFANRLGEFLADWPRPDLVGLSVAALLDADTRIVQAPNLRPFVGTDLRTILHETIGLEVTVMENDVNCAVYGEWCAGAGQGARNLAMLALGTGVGGGLILDGQLYRGAGGLAGELGHMLLDPAGPTCPCGRAGHVEAYLGTEAFLEAGFAAAGGAPDSALAQAVSEGGIPEPRLIAECARDGCETSIRVLADRGRWLGIACSNLVAALQPDRILLGGGTLRCGEWLLGPALVEYRARCMDASRDTVPLVPAGLGVESAAIGVAWLARAGLDAPAPGAR